MTAGLSRAIPTLPESPSAHPFHFGPRRKLGGASRKGWPHYLARAGAAGSPGPPGPELSRSDAGGRWRLDSCSDQGSRSERRRRRNSPPQPTGGAEGPWPQLAPRSRPRRRSFITSLLSRVACHPLFIRRLLMTHPQRLVALTKEYCDFPGGKEPCMQKPAADHAALSVPHSLGNVKINAF